MVIRQYKRYEIKKIIQINENLLFFNYSFSYLSIIGKIQLKCHQMSCKIVLVVKEKKESYGTLNGIQRNVL